MVQDHLQEKEIDTLVASPESLSDAQTTAFLGHISVCSICRDQYATARQFYSALKENIEREPSMREKDLAQRISRAGSDLLLAFRGLQKSRDLSDTVAGFSDIKPGLATRFVRLAITYPVRVGASLAGMAAISFFLVTTFRGAELKSLEYVKVLDGLMRAFDVDGGVLWTKRAHGLPDGSTIFGFFDSRGRRLDGLVLVDDVHSKSGKEVLVRNARHQSLTQTDFSTDTLYCFDATGGLLWTRSYAPREFESFTEEKGGKWNVGRMFTVEGSNNSRRLFVNAYCAPFSPSVLMEIDGNTGVPLQTYAHFGFMTQAAVAGSGDKTRIILAGINNSFSQVFVAILDPNALGGLGPTAQDFNRENVSPSTEMYYLLFPRSELSQKLSTYPYNGVQMPITTFEDGSFLLTVDEFDAESDTLAGGILYSFDGDLRLKSVTFSDPLLRTYDLLARAGKKFTPLDDEYAGSLTAKIRYWDGDKFVSTPTLNRRYAERMSLP